MKFTIVRLNAPKGLEIVWRGSADTLWQLHAASGWDCSAVEHGIVALHPSRVEPLFLPWAIVGTCDVAPDAKGVKKAS